MAPIRTLLLTGQHNHDWRKSAPHCAALLRRTGRFDVTVSEDPPSALTSAPPRPWDLFVLDYNGADWPDAARDRFVQSVAAGTGLAVLHGAIASFRGWVEFERMVALLWREGSAHGDYHTFTVAIRDRDHPITRGLDDFRTTDELYHGLVHLHAAPYHVLATAYSAPETRGTGRDEPILTVSQYGRGRIFYTALGHVWPSPAGADPASLHAGQTVAALSTPGFVTTFVRGCEWAATGQVTVGGQGQGAL